MKRFQTLWLSATLLSSLPAFAHDEGHGPKLSDTGKFGGLVTAIVEKKEATLGAKAKLQYKAELVRSAEGKIQVYVYDTEMKPVDASTWGKKLTVTADPLKKGAKTQTFDAAFDGKAFVGQIPSGVSKPFNLDLVFNEKGRDLLAAFDNQD
ncbi:MAG: hypothetical protein EOP04_33060 [Proteobacteria bacterium]|nr:MAG: hypothetical protein EOP04_33060 [Pseudomonadota bacterium]